MGLLIRNALRLFAQNELVNYVALCIAIIILIVKNVDLDLDTVFTLTE